MSIHSIYVEKKPGFDVEAGAVLADLRTALQMDAVTGVRIINRYFVEQIEPEDFERSRHTIFSEPAVDRTYDQLPDLKGYSVIAVEYLPGQFDQRADSCAQCISLATGKDRPLVRTARIYLLEGRIPPAYLTRIKAHLINPVESREATLEVPATLEAVYAIPTTVDTVSGFTALDDEGLSALLRELGLAMDLDDLRFCREYFLCEEGRDPTITEIRMIDTYWSDHCRHTTFLTQIDEVEIEADYIQAAYATYEMLRQQLYKDRQRPVTLMDLATIGARELKAMGALPDLDESEEINACSVRITVDVDGAPEDWLLMFKNETHNHPTEIEPFGGAATCLGGAIRDPLSGRSYVYQAMRVTGAANPLESVDKTLPGKLPQRKIVQTAAAGYSSYGNQIGLATGHVHEIYHPGYVAKRMEIGAVLGAAPAANVVREVPVPGDVVILLGGRTGRDGCGGATGSSNSHTADSLETCGAEVQKCNPPEERKLQRLFRDPRATRLIKRCNDFGAGGVAVSIGELADGLRISLDAVPKKYDGLDGTELAISESQERMSVVVTAADADTFIALAAGENLEAVKVAEITESPRLVMDWSGNTIVDLSREFLNSNGAPKHTRISIPEPQGDLFSGTPLSGKALIEMMGSLRYAGQKGLTERFDSTIGAGTVLMPYGGKYQLTPSRAMAAKIPVLHGETDTCSVMAWGYDPDLTSLSPFHGGVMAVIESVAKVIAAGGTRRRCWLSFQEYFERMGSDPKRWGKPCAALLGALEAQLELKVAAIGGKDSMSGSFEEIDVPPTLVSFAVSTASAGNIVSPEFKKAGSRVYLLRPSYKRVGTPEYEDLRCLFDLVEDLITEGSVLSAWALGSGGTAEAIPQMCFGNRLGFKAYQALTDRPHFGGFVLEVDGNLPAWENCLMGVTTEDYVLELPTNETVDLRKVQKAWEEGLSPVFPWDIPQEGKLADVSLRLAKPHRTHTSRRSIAVPKVVIPVFPGTNCEDDTARAFRRAGAEADIFVIRNRSAEDIRQSVEELARRISQAQIIALPGGFSGGDEPDGSAKFITSFFRNPRIAEEVTALLDNRDGLICGICNGFQALVKLGLLPFGMIRDMDENSPTLTYNRIGRHQSMLVNTRIISNRSPWLSRFAEGEMFTIPISHGEGRFVADEELAQQLLENGQIATMYVNVAGEPTQDIRYNPNNSVLAIEGITSPDGRVFGKMGHNERYGENLYRNVPGKNVMDMFKGAVEYYR